MGRFSRCLAAIAVLAVAVPASADPHRIFTLKPVEIYGKVRTPVAAIEVTKAAPTLAPSGLVQALVDRIEKTASSAAL